MKADRPMQEEDRFAEPFIPSPDVQQEGQESRRRIINEIKTRGLVERAWELDVDGYTVLRPRDLGADGIGKRLLEASLALAERRLGHAPDLAQGRDQSKLVTAFGQVQAEFGILGEDPVFEEALVNPAALALVSYLLGESCILIHESLFLKGPGPDHLPLHTDQDQASGPAPFPPYAQVANATWALTDYTVDNGATCFVPGSHRLCRPPTRQEATDLSLFEPVEAEAGSLILWHGNTWHGAFRRKAPGLRVSVVEFFGRWYSTVNNALPITQEMLDRNPPRFRTLVRPKGHYDKLAAVKVQAAKKSLYA